MPRCITIAALLVVFTLPSSASAEPGRLSKDAACSALADATLAHASITVNEQLGNTEPIADEWRWHLKHRAYTATRRSSRSVRCIVAHVAKTLDDRTLVTVEYSGVVRGTDASPRVSPRTRLRSAGVFVAP